MDAGKPESVLLAEIEAVAARFVVEVRPIPLRPAPIGAAVALLVIDNRPVCEPPLVGEKVTVAVQDAPAASELPQLLVCANGPLTETDEMDIALCAGLLMVTLWPALVERQRRELLNASLLGVYGIWQREGEVRHLVAKLLVDESLLLGALTVPSRDFH